jgi:predicted AAA+ superfamily ATPase
MIQRLLRIPKARSFFLFGARGTGKSTFLRETLPAGPTTMWFDLLEPKLEREWRLRPERFDETLAALPPRVKWIVIDEIQRVPQLLHSIHRLIETRRFKFAMSGSSARKLRRGGVNLLAGRASRFDLYPLVWQEWQHAFSLHDVLQFGSLPSLTAIRSARHKKDYLDAYAQTYLREEIAIEQAVRKLEPFERFLEVAAQCNGQIINASNIASDVGTSAPTVNAFYQILEDTLMGEKLPAFESSFRKRFARHPKFFFFDGGVARTLAGTLDVTLKPRTSIYGDAFEQWAIGEIRNLSAIKKRRQRFSFLRTKDDAEVDLVVEKAGERTLFVEIKSTDSPSTVVVAKLKRLAADHGTAKPIILCTADTPRRVNGVDILPWQIAIPRIVG